MIFTTIHVRGSNVFTDGLTITENNGIFTVTGQVKQLQKRPSNGIVLPSDYINVFSWTPIVTESLNLPAISSQGINRWRLCLDVFTKTISLGSSDIPKSITLAWGWLGPSAQVESGWGMIAVHHTPDYFGGKMNSSYTSYATGHVIEHHPQEGLKVYRTGAITTNPRVNNFLQLIQRHPYL
jgi:hypothetical protein